MFFFFIIVLFYIAIDSLGSEVGHCVIQFQSINLNPSFTFFFKEKHSDFFLCCKNL